MAPTILYAALFPLALAQTSVLTALYTGYETQTMRASLIAVDSTRTTLSVGCTQTDSPECGPLRQTMIIAGSSYSADASDAGTDFTFTQQCVLGPQSAVCEESAGGSEANFPGRSTTTYEASELGAVVLTVTGDVGKLSAQTTGSASASASASTSTGAAQTGSKSMSMASVTQVSGTAAASASASRSASASPTATGAAAARVVALGGGLFAAFAGLLGGQVL